MILTLFVNDHQWSSELCETYSKHVAGRLAEKFVLKMVTRLLATNAPDRTKVGQYNDQ